MQQCLINLIWIISFLGFCLIQALFINGVYEAFRGQLINDMNKGKYYKGNILFMIAPKFIHEHRDKFWTNPLYSCVKCMSSLWGGVVYWPLVVIEFGFNVWEIPLWIINIGTLITLNYLVFKRL